jgi:hypothetical protein
VPTLEDAYLLHVDTTGMTAPNVVMPVPA